MKMMLCVMTVFLLGIFFASSAPAAVNIPDEILNVAPIYPGSVVTQSLKAENIFMYAFKSDASSDEIVAFYKKELAAKGWNVKMESANDKGANIVFEKESARIMVVIGRSSEGKTSCSVSLTKK